MGKFKSAKKNFGALREKLKKEQEAKESSGKKTEYDNSWKFSPKLIGAKCEYRVRILPHIHVDDGLAEPWVKSFSHMFNRPSDGKYIYVQCPTTYDEKGFDKCPICLKSKELYAKENEAATADAGKIYRKPRYHVNVLIKEDCRDGDDNQAGKVLVWEFGQQIFDKLHDALVDQEMDFYDPEEGNDFILKIKQKGGYTNYEMSHFTLKPSPITDDEDEMEKIHGQIYNLNEKVLSEPPKDPELLTFLLTGEKTKGKGATANSENKPSKTRDSDEDDGDELDEDEDEITDDELSDMDDDTKEVGDDDDDEKDDDDDIDLDELFS